MTEQDLAQRLARMEKQVRWLSIALVAAASAVLLGMATPGSIDREFGVVTARGIVIVDESGRERVVLGAPMARVTSDARLAETTGISVIDSAGFLAASLGQANPLIAADGHATERRGTAYGMTFYDPRTGHERGGIGAFDDGRANVCLDYEGGKEAACATVAAGDQYAAFVLNGTPTETSFDRVVMYVGADGSGRIKAFGGGASGDGVSIDVGGGMPQITVYDSAQTRVLDVVKRDDSP